MKSLIIALMIVATMTQDLGDYEGEYDIIKSVENVDKYFKHVTNENLKLELEKVIDILLITYVDSNLEEVKKLGD